MATAPGLKNQDNLQGKKTDHSPSPLTMYMSFLSLRKSFPEAPATANVLDVSLATTKSHARASNNHRQGGGSTGARAQVQ